MIRLVDERRSLNYQPNTDIPKRWTLPHHTPIMSCYIVLRELTYPVLDLLMPMHYLL